jgi:hypothetical protein
LCSHECHWPDHCLGLDQRIGNLFATGRSMNTELDRFFPRYLSGPSQAPVWCITPQIDRCIHRFYDTSPVSPSGRYAALTRLPYEDKLPVAGDPAEIVLVDLLQGTTQIIAETRGSDTQLGAQVQWGSDDHSLYFK